MAPAAPRHNSVRGVLPSGCGFRYIRRAEVQPFGAQYRVCPAGAHLTSAKGSNMSTPSDPMPGQGAPEGAVPPPPAGAVPPPAYNAPPPGYQAPPPGYAAPPAGYGAAAPMSDSDQRMWAMLSHIGAILLGFIAPLVVWLMYKDKSRFVEEQAKESLNFQITMIIGWFVIMILTVLTFGIGSLLFFVLWAVILVFCIMAGMAANKGEAYRYPFALRLVK